MIHIQIASDITTTGVEGVRWALLEPVEAAPPAATSPTSTPAAAAAPATAMPQPMRLPPPPARSGLRIEAWQLAISGLGLVAALGLAQRQLGWAALPHMAPAAAPALTLPTTRPAIPAPAASASERQITAGLR